MAITKEDVPKSLITSKKLITQKPNTARKYEELKQSSNTKVLVDIAATLPAPAVAENCCEVQNKDESAVERGQLTKCVKLDKRKTRFMKAASDIEPRKMLPLSSIAIPWEVIPERRRGHCRSSIPHCADLDVMMEPVLYLPRTGSTVSGSRSRVCASADGKGKPSKSEVKIGPSKESFEERCHLTSAYRFSPRKVGTPAPTPATPRTHDEQRRRLSSSGRTYTKESLSKTRLKELPEARQTSHAQDRAGYKQISKVQSKRAQIDQAINHVAESNRDPVESIGNELSRMSISRSNANASVNTEAQSSGLHKVAGSESAASDRAVSPSSRTNIPSDIWAELRCGGGYDHRRITPRSNSDVHISDRSRSLQRAYHSSLGLSIYSYTGESSWKPHPPRLPKSFTYMGMFKPTILPKMPAALTVVPVPSVSRTSLIDESRDIKAISHLRSIRIPPVPRSSPAPNNGIAKASTASLVPEMSTEAFGEAGGRFEEQQRVGKTNLSPVVAQEPEYLISREVFQETEELPLDDEDQTPGAIQLVVADVSNHVSSSSANTVTEEDSVKSEKNEIEETLRVLEALTDDDDEFTEAATKITCTESVVTCPKPEATSTLSKITLTRSEITNTSHAGMRSKEGFTGEGDEITCKEDETAGSKDEITRSKDGMSYLQSKVTDEVVGTEVVGTKDDSTCTKNEITCTKNEITRQSREDGIIAHDIHLTNEEPEGDAKSVSGNQNSEIIAESSNNNDSLLASPISSPVERPPHQKRSFKSPTRDLQGSYRSSLHTGEHVRSIISECNYFPKVPSDFELMPFNVESDLLLPIKIESDLLILNDDSLMDLTTEEDLERTGESSKVDEEIAIIDLTKTEENLARTEGESETDHEYSKNKFI